MTYSLTVPVGGPQVTNFEQYLHIVMFVGKCTDVFSCFFFGLEEGVMWEDPWRNISWGKRISMKEAKNFLALFKKSNEKINMKKFFQLKIRSSIKT